MNCRTSVPTATGNLVTTLAKHYGGCAAGPCWSARFGSRQSCSSVTILCDTQQLRFRLKFSNWISSCAIPNPCDVETLLHDGIDVLEREGDAMLPFQLKQVVLYEISHLVLDIRVRLPVHNLHRADDRIDSQTRFSTDFASSSLCHILFAERFQNHAIERFGHIMLAQRHRDVVPGAIHHRLHDLGDVL